MMSSSGEVEQAKVSLWPSFYKSDYTVSQEPFVQLPKIRYLVSYKVISYNIKTLKTCRWTNKHSKYVFPRKAHTNPPSPPPPQKNNEHIFNLERNLQIIQVDINTQLLYIRLKLTLNTCRCHCTKYEIFHEEFLQFLPQFPADLVTFTKEIPHGKLHFLCSVW